MKYSILSFLIPLSIFLGACSPKYDYVVHKPKVKYQKPSREALKATMKENIGRDYMWAEEGPRSFDCSGLVYYSYGRMNMQVPRISSDQAKQGIEVELADLKYGDLIFFDTGYINTGKITHVGVYVDNGKFQHASQSKDKVIISSLNNKYYKDRVVVCKRYLLDDAKIPPPTEGLL